MEASQYQRLRRLLDMPGPVGRDGRVWSYCPAHGDGNKHGKKPATRPGTNDHGRSLSLHPQFGLECFAGCRFEDIIKDLEARGPREDPPGGAHVKQPPKKPSPSAGAARGIPSEAKMVATYEYKDPVTGKVLALKGRWQWPDLDAAKGYAKTFRWWRPGEKEGSGLNDGGPQVADMPLWGAELVLAAPKEKPVWFCEGESATLALRQRGELAVCLSQGAGATEFGDSLEVLKGRTVRLWPDNDEAGRGLMMRVHRALKPLTKVITLIEAPVPEKGDAVEYFAAGGTIDALLDQVIEKPAVAVIADDHFIVRVPTAAGVLAFEFEEMMQGRHDLEAELTVSSLAPGTTSEPYSTRINLLSASAREGLTRALREQFGFGKDFNWTELISTAWARVRQAFINVERGCLVSALPEPGPTQWLIEGFLPKGVPTVLYGDGGTGKSYLAARIASSVATGIDFLGMEVAAIGPALYIDWETSGARDAMKARMYRVWRGLGVSEENLGDMPVHYWGSKGQPLSAMVEPLRRYIRNHDIQLIIIDSAMPACGGAPEDAVVALGFFNALAKLDVTALVISHVSKEAQKDGRMPDRAYGTQVWHNGPRMTWYARAGEQMGDVNDIALINTKSNDGPKRGRPIGVQVEFKEDVVTFERADVRDMTEFESLRPQWERAADVIRAMPMAMATTKDVAEELQITPKEAFQMLYARAATRANGDRGIFRMLGGTNGRPDQKWGIAAQAAAE